MNKVYDVASFAEIIEIFGGSAELAKVLYIQDPARVRQWKAKNRIPAIWWGPIADAARRRKMAGITRTRMEELAK